MATFHLTNTWQLIAGAADTTAGWLKLQGYGDVQIMIGQTAPAASDLGIELTETYRPMLTLVGVGGNLSFSLYARAGQQTNSSQATLVTMIVPGAATPA